MARLHYAYIERLADNSPSNKYVFCKIKIVNCSSY
jgi:hypothetical protein